MRLGDKIRKYRTLHGWTQKRLGEEVGFKSSTALVRINQYETYKMSPKADIRKNIAEALNVDIEALSDVEITSCEDIMYVLFELEEKYGMSICRNGNSFTLSFSPEKKEQNEPLLSYLDYWCNKRNSENIGWNNQTNDYLLWKARVKTNLKSYFHSQKHDIDQYYANELEKARKAKTRITNTSQLATILYNIIKAGIRVTTNYYSLCPCFTFSVPELLSLKDNNKLLVAEFLFEFQSIKDMSDRLAGEITWQMHIAEGELLISFCFPNEDVFNGVKALTDQVIKYYSDTNNATKEDPNYPFAKQFEDGIKAVSYDIETALRLRGYL